MDCCTTDTACTAAIDFSAGPAVTKDTAISATPAGTIGIADPISTLQTATGIFLVLPEI